jgi:NADH-quinone oxidoreductase subunit G
VAALAQVAAAVATVRGLPAPVPVQGAPSAAAQAIAASLLSGERKAVFLGNAAAQHPQAAELLALADWLATQCGATCGYFGEAGNSVGAQLVGALPGTGGQDAAQMLESSLKAYVLLNVEPALDFADAGRAARALSGAALVVALSAFESAVMEHADVMLPIAPFTETSGTFVNAEGRAQSSHGVVKPRGDARPAWKVLRVLGQLLGLQGFGHETSEEVRAEALGDPGQLQARLSNRPVLAVTAVASAPAVERVADIPIYATDPLVRRAASLQRTADARPPRAGLPTALWQSLGLRAGEPVRVSQAGGVAVLAAEHDHTLADNVVRVPAGHELTARLGPMFGPIQVERA